MSDANRSEHSNVYTGDFKMKYADVLPPAIAKVVEETFTDGSVGFNVIVEEEGIVIGAVNQEGAHIICGALNEWAAHVYVGVTSGHRP